MIIGDVELALQSSDAPQLDWDLLDVEEGGV